MSRDVTDAPPEHLKRVFMQTWTRTFPTLTSLSNRKCSLTGSKVETEAAVISVLAVKPDQQLLIPAPR